MSFSLFDEVSKLGCYCCNSFYITIIPRPVLHVTVCHGGIKNVYGIKLAFRKL